MISYFQDAFDGFSPQTDKDASIKFALVVILKDERFRDLYEILIDGNDIGEIVGDPGWSIERRDIDKTNANPYYSNWPLGKSFYIYVDPSEYELAFTEIFLSKNEFHEYVMKAVDSYTRQNPSNNTNEISKVKKYLADHTQN